MAQSASLVKAALILICLGLLAYGIYWLATNENTDDFTASPCVFDTDCKPSRLACINKMCQSGRTPMERVNDRQADLFLSKLHLVYPKMGIHECIDKCGRDPNCVALEHDSDGEKINVCLQYSRLRDMEYDDDDHDVKYYNLLRKY